MSDPGIEQTAARAAPLPLSGQARGPADVPDQVMLARVGTWLGHPRAVEIVDAERLRSARDYFERHYAAHGADLVIDYHHASARPAPGGPSAPAAGWISAMELRAGGEELWGRVQWTTQAANQIAERQYRYLSPVLRFGAPDRVSGEPVPMYIHSVALTNTPFLTELESLNEARAMDGEGESNSTPEGGERMSLLEGIAEALDLEPEQVASRLGLQNAISGADEPGNTDGTVAEAILALADRQLPVSPAVANALGVAPDADETQVRASIIRLKAPGAGLEAVRRALGLDGEAAEADVLNAIGELRESRRRDEAARLVDEAVEAGRIPPAHREFYLREALGDLAAAREVINSLPVLTARSPQPGRAAGRDLTEDERAVCRQLDLSAEQFLEAGASAHK